MKLVSIQMFILFCFVNFFTYGVQNGMMAPDFILDDELGQQYQLSQHYGQIIVLEWINPHCPFVIRHTQAQTMKNLYQKYHSRGVLWFAIQSSRADHSQYMKPADFPNWKLKNGIEYPILQDLTGEVGQKYSAKTTPHIFIIDLNGKIVYQGAIDDDPYGDKDAIHNYVDEALSHLLNDQKIEIAATKPYGCSVKY